MPGALGEQQLSAGQKREAVRPWKVARDDYDAHVLLFGCVIEKWALTQRLIRQPDGCYRYPVFERHRLLCPGGSGNTRIEQKRGC